LNVGEWIKSHPYATGGIVLGVGVLVLLLKRGGSSSGVSSSAAQLAALNANSNLQSEQIQAQQNAQNAQVSASEYQTEAGVQANEDQLVAQVAGEGLQSQVYNELIKTGETEQESNNALAESALTDQYNLAETGAQISTMGNRATVGTNIVAEALGQGNIASFNQSTASEDIVAEEEKGNLLSSLAGTGSGLLSGLFG
jgi:hypothetical protein